ncbi:Sulfhydryl oxidase 1 [Schistosoma japonicum]|nr:Sulfhydryl oxidase 1 [Schistosoma japonicum]
MMFITLLTIAIINVLFQTVYCSTYSEIEGVAVLNTENFNKSTSTGNWLVIFYRKSCGHCISYTEPFAQFCQSVKNWNWDLHLGSVDCEDEINAHVCHDFKIGVVPNLVFLYSKGGVKSSEQVPASRNLTVLRTNVALRLANVSSLELSKDLAINDPLVVESNDTLVNTLLILDYSLPLGRVIYGALKPNAKELSVNYYPSGEVIVKGHEEQVRMVLQRMSNRIMSLGESSQIKIHYDRTPIQAEYLPVYGVDVYRSLSMLLQSDVGARDVIEGPALDALKEFLNMLHETLPASQEYKAHLSAISAWVNSKTSFTGQEWITYLQETKFPVYKGPFIACNGSKPHFRGYPCGLWTLFHALTVEQYLLSSSSPDYQVDSVAHALGRFVPQFFSCTYCAFHFALNTANLAKPGESILPENRATPSPDEFTLDESVIPTLPKAPETPRDAVLWLNAIHNRVNKRLAGKPSEDPTAPKIQFPPSHLCPTCWSRTSTGELELGKTPETEESLFQFLVERYRASSWKYTDLPAVFITNAVITRRIVVK